MTGSLFFALAFHARTPVLMGFAASMRAARFAFCVMTCMPSVSGRRLMIYFVTYLMVLAGGFFAGLVIAATSMVFGCGCKGCTRHKAQCQSGHDRFRY